MSEPPVNALACPSCGAALTMNGDQGTCQYCGMVVERPYAQRSGPAQPSARPTQPRTSVAPPRPSGSIAPTLLVIALVVVVTGVVLLNRESLNRTLGGIFGAAPTPTSIPRPFRSIYRLGTTIPRDAAREDLLVYTVGGSTGSGAEHQLAWIDTISGTLRWQSQPLNDRGPDSQALVAGDMVYLVDKERLLALRASDGAPAWQASLVAEPPSGCEGCLRVVKGRVVVLQKDGSLQGFDARSGALVWSMRLADTPRPLLLVGARLAVFQHMGAQSTQGIELIDPASGAILQQILPACSAASQGSLLYYDTPVLFSPDSATMYVIPGNTYPCLQRWDLATGKLSAEQPLTQGSAEAGWHPEYPPLLIDGAIVYSGDDTVYTVDAANGAMHTLIADKQSHFYPVAGRAGVLVVLTTPTWDSNRWTILGLMRRPARAVGSSPSRATRRSASAAAPTGSGI